MNGEIVFTMADLWKWILAALAAVITIGGAATYISKAVAKARKPSIEAAKKDKERDDMLAKHERLLMRDHDRLTRLEDGDKQIMMALLALLEHGISGNSQDKLKLARNELQEYMIKK